MPGITEPTDDGRDNKKIYSFNKLQQLSDYDHDDLDNDEDRDDDEERDDDEVRDDHDDGDQYNDDHDDNYFPTCE